MTIYYFKSSTCPPCVTLTPIIASLATEYSDISWETVNFEDEPELFTSAQVIFTPTLVFYDTGVEVQRIEGGATENAIRQTIADLEDEEEVNVNLLGPILLGTILGLVYRRNKIGKIQRRSKGAKSSCEDGRFSTSYGTGTCSYHGGVKAKKKNS